MVDGDISCPSVGNSDGRPWGDQVTVPGEFSWPPMGSFAWPPSVCTDRFKIDPAVRAARRRNTPAKVLKNRAAGRGRKESAHKVAPATDPPQKEASENVARGA